MTPLDELVIESRRWIGVREHGANKGPEVEMFQRCVPGYEAAGQSWCMAFVQYCLLQVEKKLGLRSGIFLSEHCLTVWNRTEASRRALHPFPGAIVVWEHGLTSQGHTGLVQGVSALGFTTCEGNTGPDSSSIERNGDGVYLKFRHMGGAGDMRVLGFLRPF